jgi:hypothetical protein
MLIQVLYTWRWRRLVQTALPQVERLWPKYTGFLSGEEMLAERPNLN